MKKGLAALLVPTFFTFCCNLSQDFIVSKDVRIITQNDSISEELNHKQGWTDGFQMKFWFPISVSTKHAFHTTLT